MLYLSNADPNAVMMLLILAIGAFLTWAGWSLDQWREAKVKMSRQRDVFDVARRRNRR